MKLVNCLLPSPKNALTFTVNRTVAILVAVILFQCFVIVSLVHICRMEQQRSDAYSRFMTNAIVFSRPAIPEPPTLHAP